MRRQISFEVMRLVASRPHAVFAVVASDIVRWPLIINSVQGIEVLTPEPLEKGGGSRLLTIFRIKPRTIAGKGLLPLVSPFMEIRLRDELEQDMDDLAAAVRLGTCHGADADDGQ